MLVCQPTNDPILATFYKLNSSNLKKTPNQCIYSECIGYISYTLTSESPAEVQLLSFRRKNTGTCC